MSADSRRPGLADATDEIGRHAGLRAVGVAVSKLAAPVLCKRSGILVRLKTDWAEIAGAAWAGTTWPVALGRDGALKLHVLPVAAVELQHRAPLLIGRVNQFYGRAVVHRLALVQGPLPLAALPAAGPPWEASATETAALDDLLRGIADPDLSAALARLGRALFGAEPGSAGVAPGSINR